MKWVSRKVAERPNEFDLIAQLFAPLAANADGALGLADDAALITTTAGHELVVTTDCMVAGVHFRNEDRAATAAHRTLRANLSDLAAMGATPAGYTMALSLPRDWQLTWVEELAATLAEDQQCYGIHLIGGDTVSSPGSTMISITAFGEVPTGRALKRSGAKSGDDIWVSSTLGDAGLGLALLNGKFLLPDEQSESYLIGRYVKPTPRLELGRRLRGIARAVIDVSDGLLADLEHICRASGVAAEIEASKIPLSSAAAGVVNRNLVERKSLWTSGDDYELIVTAPPTAEQQLQEAAKDCETKLSKIGKLAAGSGVTLRNAGGEIIAVESTGYRHF